MDQADLRSHPTRRVGTSLLGSLVPQRFVYLSGRPKGMQQYRQLASDSDDGGLLAAGSVRTGDLEAVPLQVTVRAATPEYVLRALH